MAKRRTNYKGPRQPDGKPSRAKDPSRAAMMREEPADQLALDVRAKHLAVKWGIGTKAEVADEFGEIKDVIIPIPRQQARNPLYGTFHGLLYQTKELSREQFDTCQRILDLHNLEMKRIGADNAIYERLGFQSGFLSQDELDQRQRAISAKWGQLKTMIQAAQNEHRQGNLWAALQFCLFDDQAFTHMVGDLRLALNAGARFFGVSQKRKAA